jgi:hypothetical protein
MEDKENRFLFKIACYKLAIQCMRMALWLDAIHEKRKPKPIKIKVSIVKITD